MTTCELTLTSYGNDLWGTYRKVVCRTHGKTLYEGAPVSIGSAETWQRRCAEMRFPPVTVEELRKAATAVYLVCDAVVATDLNRLLRAAADAMQERDDLRARLETPPC